jgi:hypothetical protein
MRGGAGRASFAIAVAIAALVFAPRASADVPAQRVILAPTPTPTPDVKPIPLGNTANNVRRAMDLIELRQERMTAIARTLPRRFRAPGSAKLATYQDVQVVSHATRPINVSLDYCAKRPLEVDRVSGDVAPGGTLTFSGICLGSSGTIPISVNYVVPGIRLDSPHASPGTNLQILSWTESRVTARIPDISGALDQIVRVQLVTTRTAGGKAVIDPRLISAPIQLRFIAAREKIEGSGPVDNVSCERGDVLHSSVDDYCDGPLGPDKMGWALGGNCAQGSCYNTFHIRKSAGAGTDAYNIRLNRGFVLDSVQFVGGNGEVIFDSSIDPAHVSWAVRWRTVETHNPDAVKRGHPEFGTYYDGSYSLYVTITGPRGCFPLYGRQPS